MDFKAKYTLDKTKEPNKILITPEYFAVCELLQALVNQLRKNK